MKYLVKVKVDGKVETYTTEATDAAAAMLQAYDKYGVCGVMVSPVEEGAAPSEPVAYQCRERSSAGWHWQKWRECDQEQYRLVTANPNDIQEVRKLFDQPSPVSAAPDRNAALEEAAVLCETAELFFSTELWLHSTKQDMTANTAIELADKIRALKSTTSACPVDTAITNLDALLAERRASTMDHAQLAALGREKAEKAATESSLTPYLRQLRHNDGSEGLVFAYEKAGADRVFALLRAAFHINMLRAFPEKSHAEIAAEIDKATGETK